MSRKQWIANPEERPLCLGRTDRGAQHLEIGHCREHCNGAVPGQPWRIKVIRSADALVTGPNKEVKRQIIQRPTRYNQKTGTFTEEVIERADQGFIKLMREGKIELRTKVDPIGWTGIGVT